MGKLVRLELYNFKTYRGKHTLPFGDSYFTSIIGPNGSGKSNSMDAISFVLGIKSASLRSRELRELVYRGRIIQTSKTAVDEANGDTNSAQNGDTQEDGESQRGDPKTAWVEAVFEDDADNMHRWRRTITTAGQSEYRINGRVVSAKAYNEALEEQSILVKARAFLIPQGEVEEVAKKPPKEITYMIEQISGSLEMKADYERLKMVSDAAAEDNSQFLHQKRQINAEIKTYSELEADAKAYERKIAERDDATVTHVMWKLYHHQQAIQKARDKISNHQEELKEHKRGVEKYHQKLQEATQAEAKVKREISKTNNSINSKAKEIEDAQNSLVPIEEKIRLTTKEVSTLESRIGTLKTERDAQSKSIADFDKNLAQVKKAEDKWEAERAAAAQQQGQELSAADEQEYNRLRSDVAKQTHADSLETDRLKREVDTEREHERNLRQKVDSLQATVDTLNEDISQLQERLKDRKSRLKELQQTRTAKNQELNKVRSDRQRLHSQYTELNQLLNENAMKLHAAESGRRESRKEAAAREIVSQMKRIFGSSIYGRYRDLIKPKQRKYDQAVGTLLGHSMEAVIVDTDKTARDCVQYLKEQKLCQMTFIPLDSVTVKAVNQNLKGVHEGMRLGIDCIDYPSHLERAISSACGDGVICDNLKLARYLCFERKPPIGVKAVTLDGSVITRGNIMTGGTLDGPNNGGQRWGDQEIETLQQKVDHYRSQLEALPKLDQRHRDEDALEVEILAMDEEMKRLQSEVKTLDRNVQSKKKELDYSKGILTDVKPEYATCVQRLRNKEGDLESIQDAVNQVVDQIFSAFCQRLGYASVRDYEAQQGTAQQEAAEKRLQFRKQRSTLENMKSNVQQRLNALNERLTNAEDKIQRNQASLEGHEEEREELQNSIDVLQAELEALQETLSSLEETRNERTIVVKEARRKLDARNEKVKRVMKDVEEQEQVIKSRSAERYNLLKKCRLDEITIPLTEDSAALTTLPMTDTAREADSDSMDIDEPDPTQIEDPTVEDYGIEPDFEELDEELRTELDEILEREDSEDDKLQAQAATSLKAAEAKLTDAIAALDAEISKANPNMKAGDRLVLARDKLKQIETDFATARKRALEAKGAFEKVKEKRMELFMKAYDHIHENILPVYQELTKSPQFPLGGTAYLDLEDSSEPYLAGIKYHAMPPLKRFRDMEHLSGGERTIAALALIFAIHSYQPSPFFVLDEVDAALDNVNVGRVADYVTKHAGPGTQFIVITHKAGLFQESETLVGIMRDQGKMTSKAISLDLRKYQENPR
ncbi:putative cohesin complex subunit [Lentithecium fluviatile CBS 122367]|uniref:Structural maintenance of chromosomes protein n=1 Tax=Lentithecium fluviatile CBS 122367 TaxID=1168545 RepID=A0A6G1JMG1_9PLEO|nr:putative cohesin complex subunit [Lentithecium fluviatile CBS 122367]